MRAILASAIEETSGIRMPLPHLRQLRAHCAPARGRTAASGRIFAIRNSQADDLVGEGFRMPAIAGGPCEDGPAYGNRPSTNPRGAGARLWGFEDSAATV